ncbi:MAG TPA: FtsX-like permease family protein, partial [Thermoanaerobaculia bacterium]
LPPAKYLEGHQREDFVRKLLAQVRNLPGVEAADITTNLPVDNRSTMVAFLAEGRPVEHEGEVLIAHNRLVSTGYLGTMGIDVFQGRGFNELDAAGGAPVVIVSRELARRYWPGRNPVGQRVKRAAQDQEYPWMTVIGVAEDVKDTTLEGAVDPTWYLPYPQQSATPFALNLRLAVRSASPSPALAEQVIGAIRSVERQLPVYAVATMEEQIEKALGQRRFGAVLFGIFAVLGLVLAAVGLYGVMSYSVNQRVREIGVRMALGAHAADVLRLVVLRGLALTLIGLTLGLAGALALTRLLTSLLYEVEPDDPVTFVTIAAVLSAVALLASYLPARRATRVDPVIALRFG